MLGKEGRKRWKEGWKEGGGGGKKSCYFFFFCLWDGDGDGEKFLKK